MTDPETPEPSGHGERPPFSMPECVGAAYVLCRCLEPSEGDPLPDEARAVLHRMADRLQHSLIEFGFLNPGEA